jgi:hypothetical protein
MGIGSFRRATRADDDRSYVPGTRKRGSIKAVTKDAKDNKRGCFIVAALVAAMVAALAYGILRTGEDPRSNGLYPSGVQPAPATGSAAGGSAPAPTDPEV